MSALLTYLFPILMIIGVACAFAFIVKRTKTYLDQYYGPETDPEKAIIKLASKMQGKITVPDICTNTQLSVSEAKQTVEHLTNEGLFHRELSDSGAKVYVLSDMASLQEKKDAKKLID